jgi:hypothetical protein
MSADGHGFELGSDPRLRTRKQAADAQRAFNAAQAASESDEACRGEIGWLPRTTPMQQGSRPPDERRVTFAQQQSPGSNGGSAAAGTGQNKNVLMCARRRRGMSPPGWPC